MCRSLPNPLPAVLPLLLFRLFISSLKASSFFFHHLLDFILSLLSGHFFTFEAVFHLRRHLLLHLIGLQPIGLSTSEASNKKEGGRGNKRKGEGRGGEQKKGRGEGGAKKKGREVEPKKGEAEDEMRHPLRAVTPPVQSPHIKQHKKVTDSQQLRNLDTAKFYIVLHRSRFPPFHFLNPRPLSA